MVVYMLEKNAIIKVKIPGGKYLYTVYFLHIFKHNKICNFDTARYSMFCNC